MSELIGKTARTVFESLFKLSYGTTGNLVHINLLVSATELKHSEVKDAVAVLEDKGYGKTEKEHLGYLEVELTPKGKDAYERLTQTEEKESSEKDLLSIIDKKQPVPICQNLRIMISSTIDDLRSERQTIKRIANSIGFVVLRSEKLSAPGKSSLEVCEKISRECDLYVGILGAKYGSEFPEIGTSVVEFEYNIAKDNDKSKVMIYIKDVPDRDQKQRQFIKQVEHFSQGLFRHPYFKNIEELGKYFKKDLSTWITERVRRKREEIRKYKTIINFFGVEWDLIITEDLGDIELSDPYCPKCGVELRNYGMWISLFPYPESQIKTKLFS